MTPKVKDGKRSKAIGARVSEARFERLEKLATLTGRTPYELACQLLESAIDGATTESIERPAKAAGAS